MDNLQISTGEKRIPVSRDGVSVGELVFNPSDTIFAEKFYRLLGEFQTKLQEYQSRSKQLDANQSEDENGLPENMSDRLGLVKEACQFIHAKIDDLFGIGVSAMLFGEALSLDAVQQFFEGITPFIRSARVEKIQKYTHKKPNKKVKQ